MAGVFLILITLVVADSKMKTSAGELLRFFQKPAPPRAVWEDIQPYPWLAKWFLRKKKFFGIINIVKQNKVKEGIKR